MDLDEIKRGLRAEIKKRENEQYFTFQCNVRQMCKDRINENYKSCISELVKHFSDKFNEKLNKKILESFKDKVFINTTHFNSFGLIEEKYKVDCEINLALDLDSAIDNMLENSIINVEEKEAKQ